MSAQLHSTSRKYSVDADGIKHYKNADGDYVQEGFKFNGLPGGEGHGQLGESSEEEEYSHSPTSEKKSKKEKKDKKHKKRSSDGHEHTSCNCQH